jgi:glycosyltransferase involved in cell wall biosynthesis
MNILLLVSSQGNYGIENMMITLAQNLRRSGCRSIIAAFHDSRCPHTEVTESARNAGLEVDLIPCSGRFDWNVVRQLRDLIEKYNLDIVHPHGYKADFYAYIAAWRNRVALLATSHNWPSKQPHMRAYAVLDRFVLRDFHRVVVVSDAVAESLRRSGVSEQKLFTIFNGVDLERFETAEATLQFKQGAGLTIGFVGRLVPDKGGRILLQAAQRVLNIHPDVTFVFVGDGPCRAEWKQFAEKLGIEKQVVFAGARNEMPETYASLDLVVLPSLVESMPMCVLEGMAAGKPVIATRVGMIPNVITDRVNGLLVAPGSVEDLADAIMTVLQDPSYRKQLGVSGQRCIAKHFSAEAMAHNYLNHYRQVLAAYKQVPIHSIA